MHEPSPETLTHIDSVCTVADGDLKSALGMLEALHAQYSDLPTGLDKAINFLKITRSEISGLQGRIMFAKGTL